MSDNTGGMPADSQIGGMPNSQAAGGKPADQNDGGGTPLAFETWIGQQDEQVKSLVDGHVKGLRTALDSLKQQREELRSALADAAKNVEGQSKAAIEKMTAQVEQAERRAGFAEEAVKPEIGCTNPRAAYLVAEAQQLFDRRGNPDWEAIKAAVPELFRKTVPPGNAGEGTRNPPPGKLGMNDWIRQAAGRTT